MAKSDYYRVKQAFGVQYEGAFITLPAGEIVSKTGKGGKLLKQLGKDGVAEHFEEIESFGQWDPPPKSKPVVEEATSSPGEKRATKPKSK